jgi:hypothetical protein
VVCAATLDLRRAPDHASELRSQLLLGEVVRVLAASRDGRWWRVENAADGYRGWARAWGLVGASRARARSWLTRSRVRVVCARAEVRARAGSGLLVSPLPWNSRVIPRRRRGGAVRVELPDGRAGWVEAAALAGPSTPAPGLMERVGSLLGVPYLWGGRTPAAFDCSGFVQQVLAEQGVWLPRDAHQQHRATRSLRPEEEPAPGDLLFFSPPGERVAHVGLGLGGGYFAHASGWVRLGSMERFNPLYDNGLASQFSGWRRVREAVRWQSVAGEWP